MQRLAEQVQAAPARREAIAQQNKLQEQLQRALTVSTPDYAQVGKLGNDLLAHIAKTASVVPSEADYLSLPSRHADLVTRLEAKCKELAAAKNGPELVRFGALLAKVNDLNVGTAVSGVYSTSCLVLNCIILWMSF